MNTAYNDIHHEADHLHHRTESMIDDPGYEAAEATATEARKVLEAIENDRPPRNIEDSIKRVQQHLQTLKAAPNPGMSPNDAGMLLNEYERLRRQCRELPNY
jgi:hypothetical protein